MSMGTMRASAPPLDRRVATSASSLEVETAVAGVVSVCCPSEVEVRAISNTKTGLPMGVVSAIRRANRYGSADGFDAADWRRSSKPSSPSSSNRWASCCCLRLKIKRNSRSGGWR